MTKIRVAILLISPGKAGVESVVKNILSHINTQKIEPYLVCNQEIHAYLKEHLPSENIKVLGSFFNKPTNKYANRIRRYVDYKFLLDEKKLLKWSLKTEAFLDSKSINIMHAHLVWDYWMASKIKSRRADIKYINTMHGTLALDPVDDYFPFFKRQTILSILGNVDVFTSACQYFFGLLKLWSIPIKQSELIENGIVKAFVNTNNQKDETLRICFMGGGRPHQKGGDILIHAFKILVQEYKLKNIKLLVFGHVPENSKEKELAKAFNIESYIEWRGFVEPPNHLSGMSQSDIFVLPSRHEGVANTLMEAVGMEMPIVATKVGGTPEVIQHMENGLLCAPEAADLAKNLKILIEDSALRNKFSDKNKSLKQHYYWENICLKYESLYEGLKVK